jgi:hypothetical protein
VTAEPPRSLNHRLARSGAVEASLIGAVGAGAVLASIAAAPEWSGAAGAVLAGLMLAIAVIDHRRMIIPDELNALAFIAGLIAAGARQRLVVQRLLVVVPAGDALPLRLMAPGRTRRKCAPIWAPASRRRRSRCSGAGLTAGYAAPLREARSDPFVRTHSRATPGCRRRASNEEGLFESTDALNAESARTS